MEKKHWTSLLPNSGHSSGTALIRKLNSADMSGRISTFKGRNLQQQGYVFLLILAPYNVVSKFKENKRNITGSLCPHNNSGVVSVRCKTQCLLKQKIILGYDLMLNFLFYFQPRLFGFLD